MLTTHRRRRLAGANARTGALGLALALVIGVSVVGSPSPVLASGAAAATDAVDAAVPRWTTIQTASSALDRTEAAPHTCGVQTDGSLFCWGHPDANLGDGIGVRVEIAPRQVGAERSWHSVAVGTKQTCAIDAETALWCWGANSRGQLGDGTEIARDVPGRTLGPQSGWTTVVATYAHGCGTTDDDRLWCWGEGGAGQLGYGGRRDKSVPTEVGDERGWARVAVGSGPRGTFATDGHSCAVSTDGSLWCWGDNRYGQLGIGSQEPALLPARVGSASDWADVAAAKYATCAIKRDASLWCWGEGGAGRLGDGTGKDRFSPVRVAPGTTWADVSLSPAHTCGITTEGEAWCWGRNQAGQLGDGTRRSRLSPVPTDGGLTWSQISTAYGTTCAITSEGIGRCWGDNTFGQYGDGELTRSSTPLTTTGVRGDVGPWQDARWSSLDGGGRTACGIAEGRAACWGTLDIGRLPTGGSYAQPVDPAARWTTISAGDELVCAIRVDGRLFCGGYIPGSGLAPRPLVKVGRSDGWTSVAASDDHACGLQGEALWCWGLNGVGQLGTGDTTPRSRPVQIDGAWRSVALGEQFSCGVQVDGSLWCWGDNAQGQLGLGAPSDPVDEPSQVGSRTDWRQVGPGIDHTCATTTADEAFCWGLNDFGQLGDGTRVSRGTPAPVLGPKRWAQLPGGDTDQPFTCGLRTDGGAWCWGSNGGKLGSGAGAYSAVPLEVTGGHVFDAITLHRRGGCGTTAEQVALCWGYFGGDGYLDGLHTFPDRLLNVRSLEPDLAPAGS